MAGNVTSQLGKGNILIELQEAWDRYDDTGDLTVYDLADEVEVIANNNYDHPHAETLKSAVEAFREEERYDRELAGRGDMDAAEENLVRSIKFVLSQGDRE